MNAAPHQPPAPAISCRGVVKHLGRRRVRTRVLHGIDLDVSAGQLTLLVGPSGCGKTTLISTLAGILRPEAGDIELFGTRITKMRRRKLTLFRGANVGLVFQQFNLFPALTATENVAVPLLALGRKAREAYVQAAALLDRLGLADHLRKYPSQLSVGQQQRVAIARAIVHAPRLVICDEPTAALDAASGQLVMQLLRDIALQGNRAVMVVTHDPRIFPFADRIIHMDDGRVSRIVDASLEKEAA